MWCLVKRLREVQDDEIDLFSFVNGFCQLIGESEDLSLTTVSGSKTILPVSKYARLLVVVI